MVAAATLAACNSNNNKSTDIKTNAAHNDAPMPVPEQKTPNTAQSTNSSFTVRGIIAGYLQLKNALTKDNSKDAATAGNVIVAELAKVDMKNLSAAQMKSYMDIADDLKENAEHIGANAGKLDHEREHFEMLSKDMIDLVKTFGNGGQTLYKDFCPMVNDNKGAYWISEVKEIKNPYLGVKMPTCGSVKEEIK